MILYLLFPLLIIGTEESQTANMTEEERNKVQGNQTFSVSTANNNMMKPDNVTSTLYKDERSQIEKELQNNQTSQIIAEEDENFQDQENLFVFRQCHQGLLVNLSHIICGEAFQSEMLKMSPENWCVLENIIRPYSDMTYCLEQLSALTGCYYPNPSIQDFFIQIHSSYFHSCTGERVFDDAPHTVVMTLTLIPVSLILVYLLVWRCKVQQ
ncbi:receptor activity-modifying protein 1-like isoform X2 [Toxotes jaculatrix]|nr:receptor activity-modifying protein 1-like isoform X2 [Toxotes jaculatrix]